MASTTKNGKVQLLDTARANIVPKFTSLDDERMDKTKPPVPVPSAGDIRELLTMSKDGKLPLDQRKDVMERIDAARDAMRRSEATVPLLGGPQGPGLGYWPPGAWRCRRRYKGQGVSQLWRRLF